MVSALIVGLVVVATFSGFDVLNRSSAEERRHNEAAVLAAESQEQMRSDPASTLLAFKNNENSYIKEVAGTKYTIVQKATFGNGSSQTGCAATETTKGQGTYILISSTVTWTKMVSKPVSESALITPPTGSALEIEVNNGGKSPTPTVGVQIVIKYTPAGTSSTSTLEGTTGAAGCVLFAGIPSTLATIEVKETRGVVNKFGTLSWPTEQRTLAPNILTRDEVRLAPAGAIRAEFQYEGKTKYTHKNNAESGEVVEPVIGDTFVAFNAEMTEPPTFEKGNTVKPTPFASNLFEVLPGSPGTYAETATSPTEAAKYPNGNLFPFPSPNTWTAYAGDCTSNNPATFDKAIEPPTPLVKPSETAVAAVPMTYVLLNVYTKSQAEIASMKAKGEAVWPALETVKAWLVTITNKKCAGVTPNNETVINTKHTQDTTVGSEWGGHLSAPFQPFGEYELCLTTGTKSYRLKSAYVNKAPNEPVTRNIYLNELTAAEKAKTREASEKATQTAREASEKATQTAREASEKATREARLKSEAETRSKRETSEAPAREKREKEETAQKETKKTEENTKKERLANEKKEKESWESEVSKNKKSKAEKEKELKEKEKAQETKRKAAEATEKTAEAKRESEEATTKKTRESEEASRKTAEKKESETAGAAEGKENEIKTKAVEKETTSRKAEETKETEARTEAVKAETKELEEREDIVEGGATC